MEQSTRYPYFDMYAGNDSGIAFECWSDSRSVGMHRHRFYELILVGRGSCRHMYNNTETLLIQGDAVVVSQHQPHGFSIGGETVIYNCQFTLDAVDVPVIDRLREAPSLLETDLSSYEDVWVWETTLREMEKEAFYKKGQLRLGYELNSSKQGVIHLAPSEFAFISSVLERGLQEETDKLLQKRYLEIILLELKKGLRWQNRKYTQCSSSNQKAIAAVLMYIEEHLDETLDFNDIARRCSFSPNYFRKLFKDSTGLAPVAYVNRLRIIRAFEYMQKDGMNIKEAAECVGIYDLNYFSRLFKKIMGYVPSKVQKT
ncbi:MAG: AraC family transcriptional regulator [Eubacteriales bacterium]|nr:AraC family transcriptional regulator [Eubacteriales bacterium]